MLHWGCVNVRRLEGPAYSSSTNRKEVGYLLACFWLVSESLKELRSIPNQLVLVDGAVVCGTYVELALELLKV